MPAATSLPRRSRHPGRIVGANAPPMFLREGVVGKRLLDRRFHKLGRRRQPQAAQLLYPIALLSTAGLFTAVSGLNLIMVMAVSRRGQTLLYYRELLPFFSIALVLAIGELLALAQLKLALLQALGV